MSLALSSEPSVGAGPLVNMRVLALTLRTSRQSLSAWLDRWPDFPIVERGRNGREYKFDAASVISFLREKKAEQARGSAERDEALAQLALPFDLADEEDRPGLSIKERIDALRLRRMEREEAERSGQLVEAAAVSDALSVALVQWNRALNNSVRSAVREHNLPDAVQRALLVRIGDTQRTFVRSLGSLAAQAGDPGAA